MPKVEHRWKIMYPDGPSTKSTWMTNKYKNNEGKSAETAFQDATEATDRQEESHGP